MGASGTITGLPNGALLWKNDAVARSRNLWFSGQIEAVAANLPGKPTYLTPMISPPEPTDIDPQEIDVVATKLRDAQTPGFAAAFTLDEAEAAGAFREDAVSEADAKESVEDLL